MSQQHKAPGPSNKAGWKVDIKRALQLKSFLRERGHRSYLGRHTDRKNLSHSLIFHSLFLNNIMNSKY